jgi:hypothetical protein
LIERPSDYTRTDSLIENILKNTKDLTGTVVEKTKVIGKQIEESKMSRSVKTKTSEIISKGLLMSNEVYLKTSDTLTNLNVSSYMKSTI